MIVETAFMTVTEGAEEDFLAALQEARALVEQTPGCRGLTVARGVERPQVFLLTIRWNTLDDHLVGFRESPSFATWRALLSPYYSAAPEVQHWQEERSGQADD